jgi:hypothetical protein
VHLWIANAAGARKDHREVQQGDAGEHKDMFEPHIEGQASKSQRTQVELRYLGLLFHSCLCLPRSSDGLVESFMLHVPSTLHV